MDLSKAFDILNRKQLGITSRGRSRTAATKKIKLFVIIVNGFQPLTIITKSSILDVAVVLDPPLTSEVYGLDSKTSIHIVYHILYYIIYRKVKTNLEENNNLRSNHPEKGALKICKRCSENMQQIYRRIPMLKSHFIEITVRHGCSPVNLLHIFRTPFSKNTSGRLLL